MKQISKFLTSYVTDECGQTLPMGPGMGDLKLIAMDGQHGETVKAGLQQRDVTQHYIDYSMQLLKLILIAALNSPKATEYIGRMPTLSTSTQASLKDLIEEVIEMWKSYKQDVADNQQFQYKPYPTSDTGTPENRASSSLSSPAVDPELMFEQRFGKVMADNENLIREKKDMQKDLQDLHNRLARLQENNVRSRGT